MRKVCRTALLHIRDRPRVALRRHIFTPNTPAACIALPQTAHIALHGEEQALRIGSAQRLALLNGGKLCRKCEVSVAAIARMRAHLPRQVRHNHEITCCKWSLEDAGSSMLPACLRLSDFAVRPAPTPRAKRPRHNTEPRLPRKRRRAPSQPRAGVSLLRRRRRSASHLRSQATEGQGR